MKLSFAFTNCFVCALFLCVQPSFAQSANRPAASIGPPEEAGTEPQHPPTTSSSSPAYLSRPVKNPDPLLGDYPIVAQYNNNKNDPFDPSTSVNPFPSGGSDSSRERYNWGFPDFMDSKSGKGPTQKNYKFGEKIEEYFDNLGDNWAHFESDHCFDDFISPMTNPFLNEDPRSLTEIRPIFMFQTIPKGQDVYHGGNIEYFGIQARLAITQRFSVVLHKLGGLVINPGSESGLSNATGMAEIWLGPKYTWYRNDQTGTIAATGAIFQIASGSSNVYQNTGGFSVAPYANIAQKFWRTSWGTFGVQDTLGYSFSANRERSDYLYDSIHLDYNIANFNRFYPFIEMNWFHYTTNGQARYLDFEGYDLANVGSPASGRDYLFFAFGSRFKISEAYQFGISAEFPLLQTKDLFGFRLGIDFIWRY